VTTVPQFHQNNFSQIGNQGIINTGQEVMKMIEERLDRMEDMLTTLIKMVRAQNEKLNGLSQDQAVMKVEMSDMKQEMSDMNEEISGVKKEMTDTKEEMSSLKNENTKRHAEVLSKLADIQADQDYIWKKAASK
jgi:uncharacterized coiled-coil DUF342 family protein